MHLPPRMMAMGALLLFGCPRDTGSDDGGSASSDGSTGSATTLAGDTSGDGMMTAGGSTSSDPMTGDGTTGDGTTGDETTGDGTTGDETTGDGTTGDPNCGNGTIDDGEVCDGSSLGGADCLSEGFDDGTLACAVDCASLDVRACFAYACGNAILEGKEECDGDVPDGVTCTSGGFDSGTLACADNCLLDTSGCGTCGNGLVDGDEACDGVGLACGDFGLPQGNFACNSDCTADLSQCSDCGDGIVEGLEECDGSDVGGQDCVGLGFFGGTLACDGTACTYDVSACSSVSYFEDFEGGLMPPHFTASGNLGWTVDGNAPPAGAFAAHSGLITHGQQSNLNLNVNMASAGNLTFTRAVSSEACCDYLRVFVDGVQYGEWAGTVTAAQIGIPLSLGVHTIQWRYIKDGSVSSGLDRAWVDDITLDTGSPL